MSEVVIESRYAYIAVKPCGCVPMICTDSAEHADEIGQLMKAGMHVERLLLPAAKARFANGTCAIHPSPWSES